MNCDICGKSTTNSNVCDRCGRIVEKVVQEVGPDIWGKIDDCRYIYPMVKRVAMGELRTQDVVNSLLQSEMD